MSTLMNASELTSNDNISEASENISETKENISEANENISDLNYDNCKKASENISQRDINNRYNTYTSTPPHHQGVNESHDLDWFVEGYDIDAQCEPGYLVIAAQDMSVPTRTVVMINVNVMCTTQRGVIRWKWLVTYWLNAGTSSKIRRVWISQTLIVVSTVIPVIEIMNKNDIPVSVRKGTVIIILRESPKKRAIKNRQMNSSCDHMWAYWITSSITCLYQLLCISLHISYGLI